MKFTSIKSVLFGLSTLIPEGDWNERYFLEWAIEGLRSINLNMALDVVIDKIPVRDWKAYYPKDIQYPIMMAFKPCGDESEILNDLLRELNLEGGSNPAVAHMSDPEGIARKIQSLLLHNSDYRPLKKATNPFLPVLGKSPCNPGELYGMAHDCIYEYTRSANGILTLNQKFGVILVAGWAYPTDDSSGDYIIPDSEILKRAIRHYCLHMYYTRRMASANGPSMPDIARERDYHLQRFSILSVRARNIDLPDIDTLENLAQFENRLKDGKNLHDKFFEGLGFKESIKY